MSKEQLEKSITGKAEIMERKGCEILKERIHECLVCRVLYRWPGQKNWQVLGVYPIYA